MLKSVQNHCKSSNLLSKITWNSKKSYQNHYTSLIFIINPKKSSEITRNHQKPLRNHIKSQKIISIREKSQNNHKKSPEITRNHQLSSYSIKRFFLIKFTTYSAVLSSISTYACASITYLDRSRYVTYTTVFARDSITS